MKIPDSSFLVALFLPEDVNHEKAKVIFEKEEKFLVPEDVVKETLTVITYKRNFNYTTKIWEILSSSEVFEILKEDFKKLMNFYLSIKKKISYFDACVIYFSLITNSPPCSFDKKLLTIWKSFR